MDALLIEKIKDIMRDNKNWDWKTINKALQDTDIEIAPRTIRKYRLHIIKSLGINVTVRRDMIKRFKELGLKW